MRLFQAALIMFLSALIGYTGFVIMEDGWGFLAVFFGDIAKVGWPGQFNLDFLGYLMLSAVWTAWRNDFTAAGFGLAIPAFFLGMGFLSVYVLYLTVKHRGDLPVVICGPRRVAR